MSLLCTSDIHSESPHESLTRVFTYGLPGPVYKDCSPSAGTTAFVAATIVEQPNAHDLLVSILTNHAVHGTPGPHTAMIRMTSMRYRLPPNQDPSALVEVLDHIAACIRFNPPRLDTTSDPILKKALLVRTTSHAFA